MKVAFGWPRKVPDAFRRLDGEDDGVKDDEQEDEWVNVAGVKESKKAQSEGMTGAEDAECFSLELQWDCCVHRESNR